MADFNLATVEDLAAVLDGIVTRRTLAELNLYLTPGDGTLGRVTADGANNGLYVKSGATGLGDWDPYDYDRVALLETDVAGAVADQASLSAAQAALEETQASFETEVADLRSALNSVAAFQETGGLYPLVVLQDLGDKVVLRAFEPVSVTQDVREIIIDGVTYEIPTVTISGAL